MSERYYIVADNSGHEYYIPVEKRDDWDEWCQLPGDDERSWDQPVYATRIDGRFTFTNPRCD